MHMSPFQNPCKVQYDQKQNKITAGIKMARKVMIKMSFTTRKISISYSMSEAFACIILFLFLCTAVTLSLSKYEEMSSNFNENRPPPENKLKYLIVPQFTSGL